MEIIDKWINYLKERRSNLKTLLEVESGINLDAILKAEERTPFFEKLCATRLKDLRMACIMDRFTLDSYKPECNLFELTPDSWQKEIDDFKPELVFIESAWQGRDGLWYRKIANGSAELYQMTDYCQKNGIPIVFWNKEDPIYTDTFMPAARCADFVFTTDIDCIKKYKNALGHDRVFFLHFAAQPQIHNPIEKHERKDKFCFAGAYYHKYPNRAKTFDAFAEVFMQTKGLDIYDRNYNAPKPEFTFPSKYNPCILGCLDPGEIDMAYKGYNFGINMNSVEQSQTMFARRIFELLASNTVIVGNYSRGVKNLFGDLTICTNDSLTLKKDLSDKCNDETEYRKYRLQGLRKVLEKHLYEDRLNYIIKQVFGVEIKESLPVISLIAYPTIDNLDRVLAMFRKQSYPNKHLYLIGNFEGVNETDIEVLAEKEWFGKKIHELPTEGFLGVLNGENYYGSSYLLDLALTVRYAHVNGMGKFTYYSHKNTDYDLVNAGNTYKYVSRLKNDRSIFKKELLKELTLEELIKKESVEADSLFATDEFNFCEMCKELECVLVDDKIIADKGINLENIETVAENIQKDILDENIFRIRKEEIAKYCGRLGSALIEASVNNESWRIVSNLEEKQIHYIYFNEFFEVSKYQKENNVNVQYAGRGDLDILGVCVFYDEKKSKLNPVFPKLNVLSCNLVPENAKYFRLGFRISGKGICEIKEIRIGLSHDLEELSCFLSRSNVLVLSNNYPSPQSLYRNMFVHKRVMAYKEDKLVCDVMRMNIFCKNGYEEFEGINVIEGQADRLANILDMGSIDTVCVHFLDKNMWNVLKCYREKIRIIVWLHGAEIQPWWRREYNYTTEEELNRAKEETEERQAFWKSIFEEIDKYNIHFVFVSQYFANIVFEDYGITLAKNKYSVIHNCIDTNMFKYEKKEPEQRKMLLSIRPYASRIYGNDLTVKTIKNLSKERFFGDLKFLIIGDGKLFEETLAPIQKYKNVEVRKTFLRQSEIAELYQKYGIALIPTRGDTQGVSRDEAMASGLVPITNAVTAIPEFVDDSCGILAPDEGYLEMAEGIKALYYDSDLFMHMSAKAAERVRKQSTKEYTIKEEIALIYN